MSTDEATVLELKRENAKLRPIVELLASLNTDEGLSAIALAHLQYMARRSLKQPEVPS